MNHLKRSIKRFENAMMSAAFAEEGAFEAARQELREERRVLLGVRTGQIDNKTLRYTLNTCKRIGADLDILYIHPLAKDDESISDPAIKTFLSELEKEEVGYRIIHKNGCLKQQIIDYTNQKKDILFVVIESSDNLDFDCNGRKLSDSWRKMKCPLVVVSEAARA